MRPGYLQITRPSATAYRVLWKQPTVGALALRLRPRLSNGWLNRPPDAQSLGGDYRLQTWDVAASEPDALQGRTVGVDGLSRQAPQAELNVSCHEVITGFLCWAGQLAPQTLT